MSEITQEIIGLRIRSARKAARWSQLEVASAAGSSDLTIRRLEGGTGSKVSTLLSVLKVLGVELHDLTSPRWVDPEREGLTSLGIGGDASDVEDDS